MIDSEAAMKLQSELMPGETLQWAGMPNAGIIFHSDDWVKVPFSLLWGGFAIFWEAGVLGYWGNSSKVHPARTFMVLWGILFVLIGQYLIWGRFLTDAWFKRRTYYAVTNRRVLIVQEAWKRKTRAHYLESISEIGRDGDQTGTLWLGPKPPLFGSRGTPTRGWSSFRLDGPIPALVDINDLDSVYSLIRSLREQSLKVGRSSDGGWSR